jgi:MFS transporter, PAT family, beta-lactamase induction signal transducer AmpG
MTHDSSAARPSWADWFKGLRAYFEPRPLLMLLLGFSAGLPFLLTAGTLSAWLREAGVDRSTIGFLSWIGFAYSTKWLWSPLVDQLPLPLLERALGRRRSWMLLSQLAIAGSLVGFAFAQPGPDHLGPMIVFALLVAFSSATQDIAIDAWRIEAVSQEQQGVMAGAYQAGYRIALFAAGAVALYLAEYLSWTAAYLSMAVLMAVGIVATLLSPRIGERPIAAPDSGLAPKMVAQTALGKGWYQDIQSWLYTAAVAPFVDFFKRHGLAWALVILCLVSTYRLTDTVMGVMANPFYIDLGFAKDEIATVSKVYGIWVGLAGALFGGWAVIQFGLMRSLAMGAIVGAASNLMFAWMATQGHSVLALTLTISIENFAGGFAGTALIAYMSSLTSTAFTATQYALFSSFYTFPGRILGGFSGVVVDNTSYFWFFVLTAIMGIPAVVLSIYVWAKSGPSPAGTHTPGLAAEPPQP